MKPVSKKTSSILIIYLLVITVHAQNYTKLDISQPDLVDLLPPLNSLIDSAIKNSPSVRFRDLQIIVNECKEKVEKTQWTNNLGFQAYLNSGTYNNFSTSTSEGQSSEIVASKSNQVYHLLGLYAKFPIQDLVSRKNELKLAKAEIDQAKNQAKQQRTEITQIVIKQYNELVLKYRLLKVRMNYLSSCRTNAEMAEKEFKNGIIDLSEYSRLSGISIQSEADFEIARSEFITSYMILEEIIGFKFNLIK